MLAPPQISLFRSQVMNRRFDKVTLAILEALLISKDVNSSLEVRSSLKQLMRSESIRVLQEISQSSVEQKLTVLDFFIRAFALIGDFEDSNPSAASNFFGVLQLIFAGAEGMVEPPSTDLPTADPPTIDPSLADLQGSDPPSANLRRSDPPIAEPSATDLVDSAPLDAAKDQA